MSEKQSDLGVRDFVEALKRDYSRLGVRLRIIEHDIKSTHATATIRIHYPALRSGKPTVYDLIQVLVNYLVPFSLARTEIAETHSQYGKIPPEEYDILSANLREKAKNLFKKAQKATNKNGEAGELLLYLLTEWILQAPQILAKMSLKTNPNMAVHGSDGIHLRFCANTNRLIFIWGESKLYANIADGIEEALKSIKEALSEDKLKHEFDLVARNLDFSGLSTIAKEKILSYLDPMDENSNLRANVTTCLIGFNFNGYKKLSGNTAEELEKSFSEKIKLEIKKVEPKLSFLIENNNLNDEVIEFFLLPVPSVQDFRDLFQNEIGWKN